VAVVEGLAVGALVDETEMISLRMLSYRRADGSRQSKRIPATY